MSSTTSDADASTPHALAFEGPHFVAADKPAGWLSVPGRTGELDERPCLGRELEKRLGRLWPVHRLDVEVSGLVLFARDAGAHRQANAWFEARHVGKAYEALCEGESTPFGPGPVVVWRSTLARGKKRAFEAPHGKPAITRATLLGNIHAHGADWLRVRLEPETGRPHQLRVHLAAVACPVAGDVLYGAQRPWPGPGIALRSVALDFSRCREASGLGLPAGLRLDGFAGA